MANIKSAKKRVLLSARKHDRNRVVRSAIKTSVQRARRVMTAGEEDVAGPLKAAIASLDSAASGKILHPNNAARRKSRLMKMAARAAALAADPEAAARAAAEAKAHAKGTGKTRKAGARKAAGSRSTTTASKASTGKATSGKATSGKTAAGKAAS